MASVVYWVTREPTERVIAGSNLTSIFANISASKWLHFRVLGKMMFSRHLAWHCSQNQIRTRVYPWMKSGTKSDSCRAGFSVLHRIRSNGRIISEVVNVLEVLILKKKTSVRSSKGNDRLDEDHGTS